MPIDLIITGQARPHLTGFELAQTIRRLPAGSPVILCTGLSAVVSGQKARASGISK